MRCLLGGVLATLLLLPVRGDAQVVFGRVTASESGTPLVGVFLRLVDEDGKQREAFLTDGGGRYRLQAPGPGRYRLYADLIGRRRAEIVVLELGPESIVDWSPGLDPRPLEITGVRVEGSRRCVVAPEEGTQIAAAWDEARKALEVAAWAEEQELFEYELLGHRRELSLDDGSVLREESAALQGRFRQPYVSRPASELVNRGFVQETLEGPFAFAPDARVLLAQAFLESHCFRLAGHEREWVGLAFEPTQERRVTDIEGVMWLDRATAELRRVDFTYRRFPGVDRSLGLGGHVDFERLPSGAWIVRRWALQMPVEADVRRAGAVDVWDRRVVSVMEAGGEVLRALDRAGEPVLVADRAGLTGVVVDSVRSRPLAGARVVLAGTEHSAITDEDGSFNMADLPGGRYRLEFEHSRLDSLGIEVKAVSVDLIVGETQRARLAIPTSVTAADGAIGLRGEVLDALGGGALGGVVVSLLDEEGMVVDRVLTDELGGYTFMPGADGSYRVAVDVVGRERAVSEPIDLQPSSIGLHSLSFEGAPVVFAGAPPDPDAVCTVSPGDTPSGRIWREVRDALANVMAGRRAQRVEYAITEYRRERDLPSVGQGRLYERAVRVETLNAVPGFVSHAFDLPPGAALDRGGWLSFSDTSLSAVAPDPELLYSDWFARRYCLREIGSPGGEGTVAIEFAPAAPTDTFDIKGLFIVDRATAAVESFHYRYTRFPPRYSAGFHGGWMMFGRLPAGGYFLSEWERRLPQIAVILNDPTRAEAWTNEDGGYVRFARTVEGRSLWRRGTGISPTSHTDSLWALGSILDPRRDDQLVVEGAGIRSIASGPGGTVLVRVIGRVEAAESGDAIPRAAVRVEGLGEFLADDEGRFIVEGLPPGRVPFRVEALGREPLADTLELAGGRTFDVRIRVAEDPIELEPMVVEVDARSIILEAAGFYDRRDRSGIHAARITREEIEERPGARMSDLFNRVPGTFQMSGLAGMGPGEVLVRMNRLGNEAYAFETRPLPGCEPKFYVDGMEYFDRLDSPRVRDLNFISPETIEGIEVYTGLTAPAQFNPDGCGVLLIWTRGYR